MACTSSESDEYSGLGDVAGLLRLRTTGEVSPKRRVLVLVEDDASPPKPSRVDCLKRFLVGISKVVYCVTY